MADNHREPTSAYWSWWKPLDSGSALLQKAQEMRARAVIVLNFVPTSDDSSDDRWGDALVTSLARDVVALLDELERVAGVSGSPDETRRELNQALSCLRDAEDEATHGATASPRFIDGRVTEARKAIERALAGVGEHRPDQPQNKTLDSAPAKERQDARAYPASDVRGNALNHAELCAWRFGGTCDCAAPKERDRG